MAATINLAAPSPVAATCFQGRGLSVENGKGSERTGLLCSSVLPSRPCGGEGRMSG
jgi:hypothetical protein